MDEAEMLQEYTVFRVQSPARVWMGGSSLLIWQAGPGRADSVEATSLAGTLFWVSNPEFC